MGMEEAVARLIAEAGYESFESLQVKFPGKVSDDDVESFLVLRQDEEIRIIWVKC